MAVNLAGWHYYSQYSMWSSSSKVILHFHQFTNFFFFSIFFFSSYSCYLLRFWFRFGFQLIIMRTGYSFFRCPSFLYPLFLQFTYWLMLMLPTTLAHPEIEPLMKCSWNEEEEEIKLKPKIPFDYCYYSTKYWLRPIHIGFASIGNSTGHFNISLSLF